MGPDRAPLGLAATGRAGNLERFLKPAAGYLLAAACLAWLFHDVHPREVLRTASGMNWGWIAVAICFDIASYVSQGWRWKLLLAPLGRIGTLRATQAIYVGLFANEVLPMRAGEFARTWLVSRWLASDFSAVIPSIAVERLFDGVWLAICMGLTAIFVPLPRNLAAAADVLGVAVLLATVLFLYLVYRKREQPPEAARAALQHWKPVRLLLSLIDALELGLRKIGVSRSFYLAFGGSLLLLAGQILAFWFVMLACGLNLSVWVGAVVLLIVHLGTLIPNAPANLGTYQFFVVVGLGVFGVEKGAATGFSFIVFFLLTVPLWVIGLFALARTGMTLTAIRREIGVQAPRT
ncbi:MAG TPA: lysylphosphatidylglycerol synthase transmembrane domain-containing protein [Bryobacteraceae bacterium]|nr:lysylphosphatidylglycerol synthase transmembrane domain-containing protein [Bryobacteraceae bacterium]